MARRVIIAVIVWLIVGCIISTLVAWGCVAISANRTLDVRRLGQMRAAQYEEEERQRAAGEASFGGRYLSGLYLSFGTRVLTIKSAPSQRGWREEHTAGWPMVSLQAQRIADIGRSPVWRAGVRLGKLSLIYPTADKSPVITGPTIATDRLLPIAPIWPAFAINAAFWAAMCWLVWRIAGWMTRWQRGLRGMCGWCAYPIGTSPVCTECGRNVRPRAAAR